MQYLSNTQRAYLKEAERFLLWAIVQRRKPLSSMTVEDCEAYREFIADPVPRDIWCGPRGRQKWSPLWRPFEGPLSVTAQQHTITILKSLYQFLVAHCYVIGNPWIGITPPQTAQTGARRTGRERSLTSAHWDFIEGQLALLLATSANERLRFALHLIRGTGLRLAQAVTARLDHLSLVSQSPEKHDAAPAGWQLRVPGKGGRERLVLVSPEVMDALSKYLVSRALSVKPDAPENRGAFLLGKAVDLAERAPWSEKTRCEVDPTEGIAPGTLYDQIKAFFGTCAQALAKTDPQGAQQLASASTHWLRHTRRPDPVSDPVLSGVPEQNADSGRVDGP
jgi:site-specific recombinase XerD